MPYYMLGLAVEFSVQTGFVLAGLWIMIKLQRLNYTLLGLLGASALTTVVDMVLTHFVGIYISATIVVAVLLLCVRKVTQADSEDVYFTVAVGSALTFGMNLWLMGALMGDLRVSARETEATEVAGVAQTGETSEQTEEADRPAQTPVPSAIATASPQKAEPLAPDKLVLKAISGTPNRRFALINDQTFAPMETACVRLDRTNVAVRCLEIRTNSVLIQIEGSGEKRELVWKPR